MLGVDRRAARAAWSVVLVALLAVVVYQIRRTLLIFAAAVLFAYLLSPVVNLVDRLSARRVSRNLSLAIVYLLLVAALIAAGGVIGSAVVEEATNLAARLPELLKNLEKPLDLPWLPEWFGPAKTSVLASLGGLLEQHSKDVLPVLQRVGREALSVIGSLAFLILVPILSFFFLKDGREIRQALLDQLAGSPRRALAEDILSDVHLLLARFTRAVALLCLATFVSYLLFFSALGVPYALLLATAAGLLEFIPVIGPLSAAAAILLVAGFSGYPHLVWVLAFLAAYRLFQDYVLQPYLMSSGVELHPLLVIFGVLAGEQTGGVAGMFLSIPVLATLRVVFLRIRKAQRPGHYV